MFGWLKRELEPKRAERDWEAEYHKLGRYYDDMNRRRQQAESDLEELQNAVAKFIGIATAVDVLKTTPQLESAYLSLCDAFKDSCETVVDDIRTRKPPAQSRNCDLRYLGWLSG